MSNRDQLIKREVKFFKETKHFPYVGFHGTTKKNAKKIQKHGFYSIDDHIEWNQTGSLGNHFAIFPEAALQYTQENSTDVILVCLLFLRNPMPEKVFLDWRNQYPSGSLPKSAIQKLYNVVRKFNYDGYVGQGESIVWDPSCIQVVGEMHPWL